MSLSNVNRQVASKVNCPFRSAATSCLLPLTTNAASKRGGAARNILSELASALMRPNAGIVNMKLSELKDFVDKEHDA